MLTKMPTLAAALAVILLSMSAPSLAGPCQSSFDRASDGSRCGGLSADSRPGGD